jgi:lysophospholipase L1-like esterase
LWSDALEALLNHPEQRSTYLDVYRPLTAERHDRYLLRDGAHLTPEGHRRLAELVLPCLTALMQRSGGAAHAVGERNYDPAVAP